MLPTSRALLFSPFDSCLPFFRFRHVFMFEEIIYKADEMAHGDLAENLFMGDALDIVHDRK